jgi:hypothetical protein
MRLRRTQRLTDLDFLGELARVHWGATDGSQSYGVSSKGRPT